MRAVNWLWGMYCKYQRKKLTPAVQNQFLFFQFGRGQLQKRYSVTAITLRDIFVLLHSALYLWRIVIALDFLRALSLLIVITLSLQVSIIASPRYRFEQHMQALLLLGK
jgi:hypothetical protein